MRANWKTLSVAAAFAIAAPTGGAAAADFYQGKTITIVIGSGVGGGYDVYGRLLGQFLGKHIPGNPRFIVENRPGASTRTATTYVAKIAPKDGTVIGNSVNTLPFDQFLYPAEKREYDLTKVQYIGNMAALTGILVVNASTGIKTIQELKTKEVVIGTNNKASETYIVPAILRDIGGYKLKIVHGFPGSVNEIDLAMERNEVSGRAGSWSGYTTQHPNWANESKLVPLLQAGTQDAANLKGKGIPFLEDIAQSDTERSIYTAISMGSMFSRAYWVAPEVPAEQVAILRKAFMSLMNDPEFLKWCASRSIEITPSNGADVDQSLKKMQAMIGSLKPADLELLQNTLRE